MRILAGSCKITRLKLQGIWARSASKLAIKHSYATMPSKQHYLIQLKQRSLMITQQNLQEVLAILGFKALSAGGGNLKSLILNTQISTQRP